MKVLVAFASKHGATDGIARAIAAVFEERGLRAVAGSVDDISSVEGYDAVVLGSAVYMGNWLSEAAKFARRHAESLRLKPVWLFSSGPVGPDEPAAKDAPAHIDELMQTTGAREHRIFVGVLEPAHLNLLERLAAKAAKVPAGDFRNWPEIRAWADEIAAALMPVESLT